MFMNLLKNPALLPFAFYDEKKKAFMSWSLFLIALSIVLVIVTGEGIFMLAVIGVFMLMIERGLQPPSVKETLAVRALEPAAIREFNTGNPVDFQDALSGVFDEEEFNALSQEQMRFFKSRFNRNMGELESGRMVPINGFLMRP